MPDEMIDINLEVIGTVKSSFREPVHQHNWAEINAEIEIRPEYAEALDNLDEFSHIIVLYWLHQQAGRGFSLKVHPRGNRQIPLKGLFATRSPRRPNPIGKATVRLLERRGNRLRVQGLDAIDGTPVIDIKPYVPGYDSADDARVPPWIKKRG